LSTIATGQSQAIHPVSEGKSCPEASGDGREKCFQKREYSAFRYSARTAITAGRAEA
jgi:hypothetical protein